MGSEKTGTLRSSPYATRPPVHSDVGMMYLGVMLLILIGIGLFLSHQALQAGLVTIDTMTPPAHQAGPATHSIGEGAKDAGD